MLVNFLPGLREIRAPLVSGYLWLVFFFLLLHSDLPARGDPGTTFDPLFELGDRLSALGLVTVASVAAYLVGSVMQEVLKLAGRVIHARSPLYAEVGGKTTKEGKETLRLSTKSRVDRITRRLLEIARVPGEKGINREPAAREVLGELPVVRTLLLGEHPELVGELDRLQAEADLRITVAAPLVALSVYLALNASAGWLLLLVPAVLLLDQGGRRQREAGDFLVRILHTGRADAPTVTSFELSVTAALERHDLEWKLKGEMSSGDGMAAFRYGNLLSSSGEYEKAAEPLALAAEKGVLRAYAELGVVRERLGEDEKAERAYKDGAERGDEEARQLLTKLLQGQRRSEEALAEATKAEQGLAPDRAPLAVPGERARLSEYRRRADAGDSKGALNLGMLLQSQGNFEEAVEALRRGTRIDSDDPEIWLRLGEVEQKRKHVAEAREAIERALELQKVRLGPDHLEVAFTTSRLGSVFSDLGRDQEALDLKQGALTTMEREFGSDSPHLAATLGNIGNSLNRLGRYQEALEVQERVLDLEERTLEPDDVELAVTLGNLGNVRFNLGDYREALELQSRSLKIEEDALGPEHLSVALTLGNLGIVRCVLGEYTEALRLQERSLRLQGTHLDTDTVNIAETRTDLADALAHLGRHGEALDQLERALEIKRGLGVGGVRIAEGMAAKAGVLYELGRKEEALDLQERALATLVEELGSEHVKVAAVLTDLGRTLCGLGRLEEAEANIQRAIKIWEGFGSGESPGLADAVFRLGETELANGLAASAAATSLQAIEMKERTLGGVHPGLAEIFDLRADALAATGDEEGADRARARAQSVRAVDGSSGRSGGGEKPIG